MLLAWMGAMLMLMTDLPMGAAPPPVVAPHFPDRLHAFVWRNWTLVPVERLAKVVGAPPEEIQRLGAAMGLPAPKPITKTVQRRSYLTVIRRNWHLLPYEQLLQLLDWTPEEMAYTLREDDFLYVKLGNLKPKCEPVRYRPPDAAAQERERAIAQTLHSAFPRQAAGEPLFDFVRQLSTAPKQEEANAQRLTSDAYRLSPRYCYSYFALYGDPLLEKEADPYPDGLLARLAQSGVDGVWLQAVLYKLAPFPWDPKLSARYEERLQNLRQLVARARKHGIRIFLYLNEPRAMPLAFYAAHPDYRGAVEGDHAALCSSHPDVQKYLVEAVASICRAVPDLGGFFTISGSENLTNCWSHGRGADCPRCGKRSPSEVIAEVNGLFHAGIRQADSKARLVAWDWGWADDWVPGIIEKLPQDVALMSVSEWSLPLKRGGVDSIIGEYSISAIGPGPRATKHWELARRRGLKTLAKIQAGNTWELSAVPYIPAVANVAQHAANLREAHLDGMMLGWTLGGYPSPNLEVVAEMARQGQNPTPEQAMERVATRRFGREAAPLVVDAWKGYSAAFREFPYHGSVVYNAPMQLGPANPLWGEPTGYHATMVGFPYDDLDGWRAVYPPEVFAGQFEKIADGFDRTLTALRLHLDAHPPKASGVERQALQKELSVAEAAAIHFRSVANQTRFVLARRELASAKKADEAHSPLATLERLLKSEMELAKRLYTLQSQDSRLGFEASNQYYYVPLDLMEKVLNCQDLLTRWLPAQRARFVK